MHRIYVTRLFLPPSTQHHASASRIFLLLLCLITVLHSASLLTFVTPGTELSFEAFVNSNQWSNTGEETMKEFVILSCGHGHGATLVLPRSV